MEILKKAFECVMWVSVTLTVICATTITVTLTFKLLLDLSNGLSPFCG